MKFGKQNNLLLQLLILDVVSISPQFVLELTTGDVALKASYLHEGE